MALAHKARAMLKGLAKFGEPSFLAGAECGNVAIERNASLFAGIGDTADDNPMVRYTLATFDKSFAPKRGQTLVHPSEGAFTLDRLMVDNGYTTRFVVTPAASAPPPPPPPPTGTAPSVVEFPVIVTATPGAPLTFQNAVVEGSPTPTLVGTWVHSDADGAELGYVEPGVEDYAPAEGETIFLRQIWSNSAGEVTADSLPVTVTLT